MKICTEVPSISFHGVKLIKWSAFSLSDSFDDQGLTSSLGFEFVSLRTSKKKRDIFTIYLALHFVVIVVIVEVGVTASWWMEEQW